MVDDLTDLLCHMGDVERNWFREEYARHNGHADLIRELVDGTVGW